MSNNLLKTLSFLWVVHSSLSIAGPHARDQRRQNYVATTQVDENSNPPTLTESISAVENIELQLLGRTRRTLLAGGGGSGTSIGGSDGQDYTIYCNSARAGLLNFRQRMSMRVRNSDLPGAIEIGKAGLEFALRGGPVLSNQDGMIPPSTFTSQAIITGLDILEQLQNSLQTMQIDRNRLSEKIVSFLQEYYQFLLEDVISNLDQGVYIPFITSIRDCGECENQIRELESRYVVYANKLFGFVLDVNTISRRVNVRVNGQIVEREYIFPIGPARSFLIQAAEVTAQISDTIQNTIWADRFACLSTDLLVLSSNISSFLNTNDRDLWRDERMAFSRVVTNLASLKQKLQTEACQ